MDYTFGSVTPAQFFQFEHQLDKIYMVLEEESRGGNIRRCYMLSKVQFPLRYPIRPYRNGVAFSAGAAVRLVPLSPFVPAREIPLIIVCDERGRETRNFPYDVEENAELLDRARIPLPIA